MESNCNLINQRGNIHDIRCSLKLSNPSKPDLLKALTNEIENKNRATVIKLLQATLRKKNNQLNQLSK